MSQAQTSPYAALPYATPVRTSALSAGWAGMLLLIGGLGLMVVGGCFLIGVMLIVTHGWMNNASNRDLTAGEQSLIVVLYALAFAALGAGAYLLILLLRNIKAIFDPVPHP